MNELRGILARFVRTARLVLVQTFQRKIISLKRSWLFSPATQPDAWKIISRRTYLYPSRVFRPRGGKDARLAPLVVMVHGGGFVMNNPSVDDPLARFLADTCHCVVVSIDYRKAPRHAFPAAYEDVVESIVALLGDGGDDDDLPIDRDKVILCGSSAGGNLVLATAQDARLRGKLLGIVALYPVVSFVPTAEEQMARRPDPGVPDFLGDKWDDVKDIYAGTTDVATLQDPRLSPMHFKKRADLPPHIFMVGCEHDLLCHDAKVMADKLIDAPEQAAEGRQGGDVRWTLVKGQTHGFDHFAKRLGDEEKTRVRERDLMYQSIAQWLRDVFSSGVNV